MAANNKKCFIYYYPGQQNVTALVNKFQITCPPKLVETVSIIQYH